MPLAGQQAVPREDTEPGGSDQAAAMAKLCQEGDEYVRLLPLLRNGQVRIRLPGSRTAVQLYGTVPETGAAHLEPGENAGSGKGHPSRICFPLF